MDCKTRRQRANLRKFLKALRSRKWAKRQIRGRYSSQDQTGFCVVGLQQHLFPGLGWTEAFGTLSGMAKERRRTVR